MMSNYDRNNAKDETAFTLIELVVVIAIACILAALIIPVIVNFRTNSLSIRCVNNLRQAGLLFQTYASENNGVINFHFYSTSGTAKRWNNYLIEAGLLDRMNTLSACPAAFTKNSGGNGGRVYGGFGDNNVNDPYSMFIPGTTNGRAIRMNAIQQPSEYWLLTDSWSDSTREQHYFIYRNPSPNGRMHLRHHDKANMLFADGHVEAVGLKDTKDFAINPIRVAFDLEGKEINP